MVGRGGAASFHGGRSPLPPPAIPVKIIQQGKESFKLFSDFKATKEEICATLFPFVPCVVIWKLKKFEAFELGALRDFV